ncbi:AraC family transcriptional regulator [Kitasatospora sp. NPDC093806]|uniref:AraC family transcriptional regulator n=1 Tax=Kitasatospora sp. NPDC093806 TaxID=3155075 RepID=UPI00343F3504
MPTQVNDAGVPGTDRSVFLRPVVGVELLHAYFRQHVYARHAHEGMTLALVDSGAAAFECAGRKHVVPSGSAFLIRSGEIHTGRGATPEGYRYRVLYLAPDALRGFAGVHESAVRFGNGVVEDRRLARALARAHEVLAAPAPSALARDTALLRVGSALTGRAADGLPGHGHGPGVGPLSVPSPGPGRGRPTSAVRIARDYLHAAPETDIPLQRLAEVSGVGVHHLVRSFSATMGVPPHAYQIQLRVWRARSLLTEGRSLAEVAQTVGFYDQAHFTRVFKRYTGVTPGQFLLAREAAG